MQKIKKTLIAFVGLTALIAFIAISSTATSKDGATAGNVNVVNSPVVQAQQSGAWNVGLTGSPTVQVGNSATNPVLIRDVDRPTAQPFQQVVDCSLFEEQGVCTGDLGVPDGKLLVIEQVSAEAAAPAGQWLMFHVINRLAPDLSIRFHRLAAVQLEGTHWFVPSQQVRIYATPFAGVRIERSAFTGQVYSKFTVTGYLVDK